MSAYFCYDCSQYKVPMDMHKINSEHTKRGRCKECHRSYSREYSIRQRMKVSPHNFLECDDCDRAFSKFEPGSAKVHGGIRQLRVGCPFCKSENINKVHCEVAR
jgi:protein-arginine kinase activator protein McsA